MSTAAAAGSAGLVTTVPLLSTAMSAFLARLGWSQVIDPKRVHQCLQYSEKKPSGLDPMLFNDFHQTGTLNEDFISR